jgi:dihydroorotase (homodimeric type)
LNKNRTFKYSDVFFPKKHCLVFFLNRIVRYLTDRTTSEEIRKAHATGVIHAAKYYPAGATTNSDMGVTDITMVYPALHTMAELGLILCIHSEVTDAHIDIFDRELTFIESIMKPLVRDIPKLKIVMEHISTKEAVDYILHAPDNVRATITCHHLLYNRNGKYSYIQRRIFSMILPLTIVFYLTPCVHYFFFLIIIFIRNNNWQYQRYWLVE